MLTFRYIFAIVVIMTTDVVNTMVASDERNVNKKMNKPVYNRMNHYDILQQVGN